MPLLPARKNRLPLKHETAFAFLSTAVLVLGALCFTFFVGTKLHQLSCRLGEPTEAQLLADILQKLTLLGQRFNHPGSASTLPAGDAEAPEGVATDFRGTYLGSAARSSIPALDDRMKVTIPMQIWQTIRSYDRNSLATATLFNSWTNTNPQWDHFLFDEAEMYDFVIQHFEKDVVQLFQAMPLDQMRVDVFRCAASPLQECTPPACVNRSCLETQLYLAELLSPVHPSATSCPELRVACGATFLVPLPPAARYGREGRPHVRVVICNEPAHCSLTEPGQFAASCAAHFSCRQQWCRVWAKRGLASAAPSAFRTCHRQTRGFALRLCSAAATQAQPHAPPCVPS